MAINRINETDLRNKLVSQLSNRPTDPRSAGGDNMTAQEVKARHDALGLLVKDKLNELLDALNNATVNGKPVTPLSDLITVVADGVSKSLTEWIEAKLTKSITAGEGEHAYGVDDDGEQEMLPVSASATAGAIPKYGTGGVLPVSDGTEDGHAMNKGQVDALVTALANAIAAKYTKPAGGIPLNDLASSVSAIISDALKWSNADASATPGKLVMRDLTGVAHGATYGASALGTALVNKEQFEPVKALAEGASQAAAAENYSALVGILSEAPKTKYKAGQRFLIGTYGVPDVGVLSVEDTAVSYTYTTDAAFEASLMAGTLQIGYFVLRPVEGKTNLEDYFTAAETNAAISDAIDLLVDALVDGVMAVAEANYAESATYAQQADIANQINTDREIDDAEEACPPIVFGTVGGKAEVQSGYNRFEELRGHTIKWNQYAKQLSDSSWSTGSMTKSVSDGVATLTASAQYGKLYATVPLVSGHKYYLTAQIKLTSTMTGLFGLGDDSRLQSEGVFYNLTSITNTDWNNIGVVGTYTKVGTVTRCVIMDTRSSGWDAIQIKNVQIFDLTDIYGAGNEPTTVAEFVRDFPLPYYEYNAGTLLSSKSATLISRLFNQWDEEWEATASGIRGKNLCPCFGFTFYYVVCPANAEVQLYFYDANQEFIQYQWVGNSAYRFPSNARYFKINDSFGYGTTYNHDICIYINWDTPGLPYVPYEKQVVTLPNLELRSAGSAYDVLYQQGGGKRRIGVVDLGTLNWSIRDDGSSLAPYFYASKSDIKFRGSYYSVLYPILCEKYQVTTREQGHFVDKSITLDGDATMVLQIQIKDSAYTDAETFKAAMSGVMLYYELATETDITLEENPGWDEYLLVDNFGTLEFTADPAQTPQVPQAYFVRYTVNLVEFLDSVGERAGFDAGNIALNGELAIGDPDTLKGAIDAYNALYAIMQENVSGALRHQLVANVVAGGGTLTFSNTKIVDLGSLTWSNPSSGKFTASSPSDAFPVTDYDTSPLLFICSKYEGSQFNNTNLTITMNSLSTGMSALIRVYDSSYPDVTAFKAAMKGVLLAYKKASF